MNDMKLPEGKTCGDCTHYKRCWALFECPATNAECDWAPSRFRQRVIAQAQPAGYDHAERVAHVREFFETDWETAEGLISFFDG